ncbi:hypothetical protein GCM10008927_02720 [Amylibacter ulvae]|uniref:Uncharacterized protein n=1 Tax=Paramylibacter ulvae TaxID=1651968 RepID=A0ABQ3CSD4_9RHOB|nr:hypothetical protein [Amylibacter ulvae]GHA41768.1 hypothetical protein GCM10008927_02720 [Amylibacter ulvae]
MIDFGKYFTITNIATAVTFLAAGFSVGLVLGNRDYYEDGRLAGSKDLREAQQTLEKYNKIIANPVVLDQFDEETQANLKSLIAAIEDKDYVAAGPLLNLDVKELDTANCTPNNKVVIASTETPIFTNCESGRTVVFALTATNYVNATIDGELKSLYPGQPKKWEFEDGAICSLSLININNEVDPRQGQLTFQACKGGS